MLTNNRTYAIIKTVKGTTQTQQTLQRIGDMNMLKRKTRKAIVNVTLEIKTENGAIYKGDLPHLLDTVLILRDIAENNLDLKSAEDANEIHNILEDFGYFVL